MYLYGIECDEPKGDRCCLKSDFARSKNIYKQTEEVMCRSCGDAWERRYSLSETDAMWIMIRRGNFFGRKVTCKCGVSTNVEGIDTFECKCGRWWTCLVDPEGTSKKTGEWKIGLDIEEKPKGMIIADDGELTSECNDELKGFRYNKIVLDVKSKPVRAAFKFDTTSLEATMRKMSEAMVNSGVSLNTSVEIDRKEIAREVEKSRRKKRPDKYAPRPLSSDSSPNKSHRWFLPAVLAVMTLLSGAAAVLTIADRWPSSVPAHQLLDTIKPYIETVVCDCQPGWHRDCTVCGCRIGSDGQWTGSFGTGGCVESRNDKRNEEVRL